MDWKAYGIDITKSPPHETSVYALALLYNRVNNTLSSVLRPFDLTPAQFNVLMVVKHQGGTKGLSQVDISKRLIVTASNITRLVDKLERGGFVARFEQQDDRRVNLIRITAKGSKTLDEVWPVYKQALAAVGAGLSSTQHRQLLGLLERWLDDLEKG